MEDLLISHTSSKVSNVFNVRKEAVPVQRLLKDNQSIDFSVFWQALWLTRDVENRELRYEFAQLAVDKLIPREELDNIEFYLPQLICLVISEESNEREVKAARSLIMFACLHSTHTALLAHTITQSLLSEQMKHLNTEKLVKKLSKKVIEALEKSTVSCIKILRLFERVLLFSGSFNLLPSSETEDADNKAEKELTKAHEVAKELLEDLENYEEHSLFKGPVAYRKVSVKNRLAPASGASIGNKKIKFVAKYMKIKHGFMFIHNNETHRIERIFPVLPHLRQNQLKYTNLTQLEELNENPLINGIKNFFEIYDLDSNEENENYILQFNAVNNTVRARFIRNLDKISNYDHNLDILLKEYDEKDKKRSQYNSNKINILRTQSGFINTLLSQNNEDIEENEVYLPFDTSNDQSMLISPSKKNKKGYRKNEVDKDQVLFVFDVNKLNINIREYLNNKLNSLNSSDTFFNRLIPSSKKELTQKNEISQNMVILRKFNSQHPEELKQEIIARQWIKLIKDFLENNENLINQPVSKYCEYFNYENLNEIEKGPFFKDLNYILLTSNGCLENIMKNSISLEGIRKKIIKKQEQEGGGEINFDENNFLLDYFNNEENENEEKLIKFTKSLSSLILVSFMLDIYKDDYETNILITKSNEIIFANLEGSFKHDKTNFKLNKYIENILLQQVQRGEEMNFINLLTDCCIKGFLSLRNEVILEQLLDMVKVVSSSCKSGFFTLKKAVKIDKNLRSKFHINTTDEQATKHFVQFLAKCCSPQVAKQVKARYKNGYDWL